MRRWRSRLHCQFCVSEAEAERDKKTMALSEGLRLVYTFLLFLFRINTISSFLYMVFAEIKCTNVIDQS